MGDLDSEMKKRAQKANTAVHARRIRRRSEKVSDRPPEAVPRNLPECCYHRRYLRHLDPLAKEELGAKKSDIPYLNGLTQDSDSEKESTGSSEQPGEESGTKSSSEEQAEQPEEESGAMSCSEEQAGPSGQTHSE
ncbi:hypothetical protein PQX77_001208 [Marasmius sp. AFHP31]|nr:hypothetical protein PQX77_001208 [Marasmius sp. AFHP31]